MKTFKMMICVHCTIVADQSTNTLQHIFMLNFDHKSTSYRNLRNIMSTRGEILPLKCRSLDRF